MEFLLGAITLAILELLAYIAVVSWRRATSPEPPPQPQTPSQRANEAAFDGYQANHPRAYSLRVQRATKRGRRAKFPD